MSATPKFAHIVFQTSQAREMIDWYCQALAAHVVYEDDGLGFITFDDEHHRVAFIKTPVPLEPKTSTTAAMHHAAYTFANIEDLLDRYVELRDKGIRPAVCIAHGITTSMYYRDPDGNMVEMQVDRFAEPEQATAYMNGPEYAGDSVGPAFDPEQLLEGRRAGVDTEVLCDRAWALQANLPDPMPVLIGAS